MMLLHVLVKVDIMMMEKIVIVNNAKISVNNVKVHQITVFHVRALIET